MAKESKFIKQLTDTDVKERLVVTVKMAGLMPTAEPGRDTEIRALDDKGDDYQFYLAGRRGEYRKPTFKRKDWIAFINKRGAREGDYLYFWRETNKIKRTEYRIQVLSPEEKKFQDLKNWATNGGLALALS